MTVLSDLTKAVGAATLAGALFKPVVQGIWAVKVFPTARRVTFRFLTTQKCVPLVEIFPQRAGHRYSFEDIVPENVLRRAWPVFAGARWQHEVTIDNLDEGGSFYFKITADPDPSVMPGMTPAYQSGWFGTSKRNMTLKVDELKIERAGDPSETGELYWFFMIWNFETGRPIFQRRFPATGYADVDDGTVETDLLQTVISSPPDYIGLITSALDDDTIPFPPGLGGGLPPVDDGKPITIPMTKWRWYEDNSECDQVYTRDIWRVPDSNGAQGYKFTIDSGEWKLWYKFTLSIIVRTTPSKQPPLVFNHQDSTKEVTEIPVVQTMSLVPARGAAERITTGDKTQALVAVSNDGRLRWSPRTDRDFTLWHSLPEELQGPVAIAGTADYGSHLFAIGVDGRMRHACLDDAKQSSASWHDLGGSLTGHPAVLQAPDGKTLWLFALDPNGAVQHCELAADSRRTGARWHDLGGTFASGLTAQTANGERCHLFALDSEGAAHHLLFSPNSANGRPRWRRLGGKGLVTLTAIPADDGLALVGLDRQRRLFGRLLSARTWLPENDEWIDLGDCDSFGWKEQKPRGRKAAEAIIAKGGNGKAKRKRRRPGIKPRPPHSEIRAKAAA